MKVTILGKFLNKAAYVAHHPYEMQFCYGYEPNGEPLSDEHTAKVGRILDFYYSHNSSPIFLVEEYKPDPNEELEAQAMLELNMWSNAGEPRFVITDINTGEKKKASGNGGGRPRKTSLNTSPETSSKHRML